MKGNDDETPQGNNSEKSIDPAASKTSAEGLSRRQMLSFGQPIVFNGSEPEDEREVLAEWLVEAMRTGRTVYLEHAFIVGPFDARGIEAEGELVLSCCTIKETADFSRSIFRRRADL